MAVLRDVPRPLLQEVLGDLLALRQQVPRLKASQYVNVKVLSLYSTATQNSGVGGIAQRQPPTPEFCVGDTNMLVSWSQRKPFNSSPNASQWNIGCVGSPTQKSCVGYVHFMFLVLISTQFPVEYGLYPELPLLVGHKVGKVGKAFPTFI